MLPRTSTPTNGCWDKLSFSIWQRFTAIKQTEKTFLQKMNLWGHLYECVQKIPRLPKFELFLMGSTISGFGMEGSDIDMCVVAKDGPLYCDLRTEALENLLHVKQFLDRMPSTNLEQISLICAMVPILRLKHKPDDFDIEISFNNYVGIRNTQLLHCYAQLDWRVRPLVIIVKLWAKHNNLNDPKNCTLSSYSLALMVINFLQCGVSPPVLPCLHELYPEKFSGPVNTDRLKLFERVEAFSTYNDDTLSSLFTNFLKYYTKFDYKNYALSVRTGTIIPAKECAWKSKTSIRDEAHCYLSIEEPFNRTNTAKSVHNGYVFEQIKFALAASWRTLEDTQDLNDIFAEPLFSTPTLSPLTNSSSF
ncbi:poly(A) RNA polymerase gld-2 homolog A-like [Anopheles ziemanni]|uniref:poly(A) RNA polymerase gld-2 homolog A-like n=1 Tax=Anopheles coustani TaxID=139045 RepID=UPI002658A8EC|nr:poly(A) RNA polymerase gld-2 homolog A-like [Anopheles coustani]XP_058169191.1 poly(A) RNA polymerase gld-2 homolog A-like [Anopheles ziemanni]